jgi:putative CocE/NonD family hydrolase
MRSLLVALVAVALTAGAVPAAAQAQWTPEPATYGIAVTRNVPIRMRDGTVLRADVHTPADPKTGAPAAGPFPVILSETPYGKVFAIDGAGKDLADYSPYLVRRGFIQAIVDVRGTGASEGSWDINSPAEAADSAEVVRWASRLPRSNGRVGMRGISYGGLVQLHAAAAVGPNSPLKAIFPIFAGNDPYRDLVAGGGMLNLETVPAYLAVTAGLRTLEPALEGVTNPADLLRVYAGHLRGSLTFDASSALSVLTGGERGYDGAYWQERSVRSKLGQIARNGVAAYLVAGLNDAFQGGQPLNFSGLQNAWAHRPVGAPMPARRRPSGRYQLLVGPWVHVLPGQGIDLDAIELRWFDRWLKLEPTGITRTRTPVHVIDAAGHHYDAGRYPLERAAPQTLYLREGGGLGTTPPAAAAGSDRVVFTGISSPCDRATEQWSLGILELVYQSLGGHDPCAGARPDLPAGLGSAKYTTPPFATPHVIAGPIGATVYATANTRDTEWIATLADVAPDGRVEDLTQGALLGSLRAVDEAQSWKAPDGHYLLPHHPFTRASQAPVQPGRPTRYDIEILPTFATLEAGHRLRLTIATGETPHLLPLPGRWPDLLGGVYDIQRTAVLPSSVTVPMR